MRTRSLTLTCNYDFTLLAKYCASFIPSQALIASCIILICLWNFINFNISEFCNGLSISHPLILRLRLTYIFFNLRFLIIDTLKDCFIAKLPLALQCKIFVLPSTTIELEVDGWMSKVGGRIAELSRFM